MIYFKLNQSNDKMMVASDVCTSQHFDINNDRLHVLLISRWSKWFLLQLLSEHEVNVKKQSASHYQYVSEFMFIHASLITRVGTSDLHLEFSCQIRVIVVSAYGGF